MKNGGCAVILQSCATWAAALEGARERCKVQGCKTNACVIHYPAPTVVSKPTILCCVLTASMNVFAPLDIAMTAVSVQVKAMPRKV